MRIYISGPITGKRNYRDNFRSAERALKAAGHEVINPARNNLIMPESTTHEEYMRICLQQESCCDAIFLLQGWEKSEGAREELKYALQNKLTIAFEGGK